MPMITTTISSSISVKPLRFNIRPSRERKCTQLAYLVHQRVRVVAGGRRSNDGATLRRFLYPITIQRDDGGQGRGERGSGRSPPLGLCKPVDLLVRPHRSR